MTDKNKKRIISLITVISIIASAAPTVVLADTSAKTASDTHLVLSADESASDWTYTANEDDTLLCITQYKGTDADVTIPSEIDGKAVIAIDSYAFSGCTTLESVTIPDSVTSIGECAFYGCTSLASITLPDGLTSIGVGAFLNTAYYTDEGNWGKGALCIGDYLIKVRDVSGGYTIADNIKLIAVGAFSDCAELTSITLPDSMTEIGEGAFSGCEALKSITIPDSVTSIGYGAFQNCTALESITIPNSVTSIDGGAFQNCTALKDITIPSGITSIGFEMFKRCTALKSITIPNSVTEIGYDAFSGCTALESITLPDSMTYIGNGAFNSCEALKSVTIPDGISLIEQNTFNYCTSLKSVSIPASVTEIDTYAFFNCTSLENIAIPESVTRIGKGAFGTLNECTTLKKVAILNDEVNFDEGTGEKGDTVTPIFDNRTGVVLMGRGGDDDTVRVYAEAKTFDFHEVKGYGECGDSLIWVADSEVEGEDINLTIFGTGAMLDYGYDGDGNAPWKYLYEHLVGVEVSDGVTEIGDSAFYQCTKLENITLPDDLTRIGTEAFKETAYYFGTYGDKWEYEYDSSGNWLYRALYIDKYLICVDNSYYGDNDYAYTINDGTVLIADKAFASETSGYLKSVTIPDSVVYIGNYAFNQCSGLTSVTIPDSVTSIGYGAFENCRQLSSVTLSKNLTTLGDFAFNLCEGLESISIPSGVKKIGNGTFLNCTALASITLPDDLTEIGLQAFYDTAYYNDNGNWTYDDLYIGDYLINVRQTVSGDYTVDSNVKIIAGGAFDGCQEITSVTIPNGVKSIGYSAFEGCEALKSVTIPDSVTDIGERAFNMCAKLESVTIPNGIKSIGDYAFAWCTQLKSIAIPNSVTELGSAAFSGCTKLESVTIPAGVKAIQYGTFTECSSLKNVKLPDGLTSIGDNAFENCTKLESIIIPESVKSIGYDAFNACYSLANVIILNTGKMTIEDGNNGNAFSYCPDGISIWGYSSSGAHAYASKNGVAFKEISAEGKCGDSLTYMLTAGNELLISGTGDMYDYVSDVAKAPWSDVGITSVVITDGVTSIGNYAFYTCTKLESVTIPSSVKSIGMYAFNWCTDLDSITIPDGVKSIDDSAFSDCQALNNITLPDSITSIGAGAFAGTQCYNNKDNWENGVLYISNCLIKADADTVGGNSDDDGDSGNSGEYEVKDGTIAIAQEAFASCARLTGITIPESITALDRHTFENCTGLKSVTLPNSLTTLGASVFAECSALKSITIPEKVQTISDSAFTMCTGLENVTIEKGVKKIANYAFYGCASLKNITLPNSITSVGDNAFNSSGLESITIPNSVTELGYNAFDTCMSLKSIVIPSSVTELNYNTFCNCTALKSVTVLNTETQFGESVFTNCSSELVIKGFAESTAEAYAETNDITFEAISAGGECGDSLVWVLDSDNTLTISGTGDMYNYGEYDFSHQTPWDEYKASIKSVVIEDGVTSIGRRAFYGCSLLDGIDIADSVEIIGANAFDGTPLYNNEDNWKDDVLFIGKCLIKAKDTVSGDYKVADGIIAIADDAFRGCEKLTGIIIPDGVRKVGENTFYECRALTSVILPNSVDRIVGAAFYRCVGLKSIILPEGVNKVEDAAFYDSSNLASVTVLNKDAVIDSSAFGCCSSELVLKGFPNSTAEKLASETRYGFEHILAYGACGDTLVWIMNSGLGDYYTLTISGKGDMYDYDMTNRMWRKDYEGWIDTVVIEDGVTSIGSRVFDDCDKLQSVTIPGSVQKIGTMAFQNCDKLQSVTIPDGVKRIGADAFINCRELDNVKIADSVAVIGVDAFAGTALYENKENWKDDALYIDNCLISVDSEHNGAFEIKDSTVAIAAEAFAGCFGVSEVNIPEGVTVLEYKVFKACTGLTSIVIPDSVTEICGYTFSDCSGLKSVAIPDSVKSVGDRAFEGCEKLTSVIISEGVTTLGDRVFAKCENLKDITVLNKDMTFGAKVFSGCPATAELRGFADSTAQEYAEQTDSNVVFKPILSGGECGEELIWSVGTDYTLMISGVGDMYDYSEKDTPWKSYESQIKSVVIADGVTGYSDCADTVRFDNLESVSIADSVKSIGKYAFYNCSKLSSLELPYDLESVGEYAFYGYGGNVFIPFNTTVVGKEAFASASAINVQVGNDIYKGEDGVLFTIDGKTLVQYPGASAATEYTVPDGVTSLGAYAFHKSGNIEDVIVSEDVESIGDNNFDGCGKLKSVTVLGRNTTFGSGVFADCSAEFEVKGYAGSTAQAYATENNLKFAELATPTPAPDAPTPTPGTGKDDDTPTPTPGTGKDDDTPTPTPGTGKGDDAPTPTPGTGKDDDAPTPTPGTGKDDDTPSPTPTVTPSAQRIDAVVTVAENAANCEITPVGCESGIVIVALFDDAGMLIGIDIAAYDGTTPLTRSVSFEGEPDVVKIVLWKDFDDMKALCNPCIKSKSGNWE